MWMLNNKTPYAAERNWVLDKNAVKSWVVAVKGTFDILPDGTTALAEEQELALYLPKYAGADGESSLIYEADLVGPKKGTDVLLNGHAYAPQGRPVKKVNVAMRVGPITKELVVFGDRRWQKGALGGLSMTAPEPFVSMPITYERAFGGYDKRAEDPSEHRLEPRNPIGTGFATRRDHLDEQALPNVEYPKRLISSRKDRPPPAGFGAIASYWSPRLEYAGTYDRRWLEERMPLLAEDFDERYYQCAPADQQVAGFLGGGEPVELVNLTPEGMLRFRLPSVKLAFTTQFGSDEGEHDARLHTVILEPDVPRVIMVWCTHLECHHRVDELEQTIIEEKH